MNVKIGLEVHCQLTALKTKLFCSCSADYRGEEPNTLTCPTCLGLPGSLPALNEKAVEYAIMVALALNSKIAKHVVFYRKNYFYPDMPKNFQISMYDRAGAEPLGKDGYLDLIVEGERKRIRIRRIHLEEDPGRLVYPGSIETSPYTLVDYNRAGIALLEIVTEPDMESPREAREFCKKLRSLLEHLGVSDGSLEGAMRCDANISIEGGPRVEVKNITSFKEVERALSFEIARQRRLAKRGVLVRRETRHWDERRRVTFSMRIKEEIADYRYFPEPDLVPVEITDEMLERIREIMPELPDQRRKRFIYQYGLPEYDAEVLSSDKALADFFEECLHFYRKPKIVSNWLMGDFLRYAYECGHDVSEVPIAPKQLTRMLNLIDDGTISGKIAKVALQEMMKTGKDPEVIVREKELARIADVERLTRIVEKVFAENPQAVQDALVKEKAIHFLVGIVMKETRGKADPQIVQDVIRKRLARLASSEHKGIQDS